MILPVQDLKLKSSETAPSNNTGSNTSNQTKDIIPIVMCVNMTDYLKISIAYNRKFFNKFFVITSPSDIFTKQLCKKYDADVIEYNNFFTNAKFNKSGGMAYAQEIVHKQFPESWILLLDTDIVLTPECINIIDGCFIFKKLDKTLMYSVKRFNVLNQKELDEECKEREYALPGAGYFQLYYDKTKMYPSFSNTAGECDMTFAFLFSKRVLIPTHVYHLGEDGMHWNGRGKPWTF